jgi:hypothetical protein
VTAGTDPPAAAAPAAPAWRKARGVGILQRVLIACAPFGPSLSAETVARAIARGIQEGGLPEPDVCALSERDVCALPIPGDGGEAVRRVLEELDFDTRMRGARAVIVGAERLEERTLAGSVTFEIATRAPGRSAGLRSDTREHPRPLRRPRPRPAADPAGPHPQGAGERRPRARAIGVSDSDPSGATAPSCALTSAPGCRIADNGRESTRWCGVRSSSHSGLAPGEC